jgi:hypothetical protein
MKMLDMLLSLGCRAEKRDEVVRGKRRRAYARGCV